MSLFSLVNVEHPTFELHSRFFVLGLGEICDLTYMMSTVHSYLPEVVGNLLPLSCPTRWVSITKRGIKYLPIFVCMWYANFKISEVFTPKKRPFIHPSLQKGLAVATIGFTFSASKLTQFVLDKIDPILFPLACLGLYFPFRWLLPLAGVINLDRGIDTVTTLVAQRLVVPCRKKIMSQRSHHFRQLLQDRIDSPSFKYPPLHSSTMIRLLKLQNDTKDRSLITCQITDTELSTAPPYDAVSYVWGNPKASASLLVGPVEDSCIPIAENARCVLAAVTPLEGTRYIWMDSICIDQSNEEEKAQQIPMMGKIYARAQEVISYLKPSSQDDADAAIAFMNRLTILVGLNANSMTNFLRYPTEDIGNAMTAVPLIPINDPGWSAFDCLVSNEYWSRLWIIQECVAAKQLTFIYGNAPCELILLYCAVLSRIHPSYLFHSRQLTPPYAAAHILGILLMQMSYLDGELDIPLSQLVSGFGVARASVPADRVNALLGISEDHAVSCLQPSPQKSPREVYTDMVRHALSRGHFDNFAVSGLCNPRSESELKDLPSWVPDLTCPVLCRLHHYHTRGYAAGLCDGEKPPNTEFLVSPDGSELALKGLLFDTIQICSSDPDWTEIELDRLMSKGSVHELGFFP
jgi:hypothetical protein